jgi:hypothetical protein
VEETRVRPSPGRFGVDLRAESAVVRECAGGIPSLYEGGPSSILGRTFAACREKWAARPTERRLACNQEIGVRLPGGPPAYELTNLDWNWKVAGYGWPGRTANAVSLRGMRVRIPCLPLDLFEGESHHQTVEVSLYAFRADYGEPPKRHQTTSGQIIPVIADTAIPDVVYSAVEGFTLFGRQVARCATITPGQFYCSRLRQCFAFYLCFKRRIRWSRNVFWRYGFQDEL